MFHILYVVTRDNKTLLSTMSYLSRLKADRIPITYRAATEADFPQYETIHTSVGVEPTREWLVGMEDWAKRK